MIIVTDADGNAAPDDVVIDAIMDLGVDRENAEMYLSAQKAGVYSDVGEVQPDGSTKPRTSPLLSDN